MTVNTDTTDNQGSLFETALRDNYRSLPTPSKCDPSSASEMMRKKGWAFLRVSGKSMFPWIRENDVVFVRSISINSMLRGDVAAFEKNGILCVHRVLSVVRDSEPDGIALITKGDATGENDDRLSAAGFRGKVEFVYRGSREIPIASGWRRHFGKLLALISPIIGWCKPAAPIVNTVAVKSEVRPSPPFAVHRSTEDSAD